MQKLFTLALMLLTTVTLSMVPLDQAEAKRFGFGKSFGKSYSSSRFKSPTQKSTSTTQKQSSQTTTGSKAPATGSRRWLGPLAGLAAGGLLASLFMGDAFEGIQFMDILLFAALAFGAMALFRAMRARQAPLSPAGAPFVNPSNGQTAFRQSTAGALGDARFEEEIDEADVTNEAPSWFNAESFVAGSKTHYLRLQTAWDKGDMKDIAEYTTPQFYAELQAERLNLGDESHFTDVVSLDAEMVALQHEGDQVVASVRFSGLISEEQGAEAEAFSEVWHITHDWEKAEGDWFVAGIQQD